MYLLGNPFVWWLSTASILVYAGLRGLLILRQKRGYKDLQNSGSPLHTTKAAAC